MAMAHMGNHPTLKLIQIMALVKNCDVLLSCREDILGILKHMIIWKSDWRASKDLLRRMGWSMVEVVAMNTNPPEIEVPLSQFVKMNVLLWNYRGALNPDFKRRIFEMAINHRPSILVILWKLEEVEVLALSSIEQEIHVTVKEEEYWALKSRINAATFGDRNTSFFHISTIVRRQRNKIRCLMDAEGNWLADEVEIKNYIRNGFKKLYMTELIVSTMTSNVSNFSCCFLEEGDRIRIDGGVTEEEVRAGLWSLKPFKAPRPDGLHAGFYQRFWLVVKNSIYNDVKGIFDKGCVPSYLNETLISLNLKCQNPETLNNYRPISLCNSVYKIVSKILVARIRPLLSSLISPVQAAFVPGRKGMDNVLIAQELFHALDKKKGKMGFMAVKLDLEKAYDHLEWGFIHRVLQAFHFPQKMTKLVMSCVTTSSTSILINGGALERFEPSRGIRQGDHLSPYLFILCMEYLGHLIEQKCARGDWAPLKASKDNVGVSHLLFADDIILFSRADVRGCEAVLDVLGNFCKESGQKINPDKSRIYFSPNVSDGLKEEISDRLGIRETNNIRKYLGFPIKHRGVPRNAYNFIVERVMKNLSFSGQVVLIKSVMSAIPNHVMQGAALPIHVCEKLDKINREFLWGSTNERRKMHMVGWSKIVKSKDEGGLGIQEARAKNIALLSKLNWRMYHEQDALWAKVLLKKYCANSRVRLRDPEKLPSSPNWKAISLGFPIFCNGIAWGIGNGAEVDVWLDNWINGDSLRGMIEGPLKQEELNLRVSDLYSCQGWNWDLISFDLPFSIKEKIKAIPIQMIGSGRDMVMWKFSKNGEFTTTSAYKLAHQGDENAAQFSGIPVKEVLADRGVNCDKLCPLCRNQDESIIHVLHDCVYARDVWQKLEVSPTQVTSFADGLEVWLKTNSLSSALHKGSIPWCTVFLYTVWSLWKNRNSTVFDNSVPNLTLERVCLSQAKEYHFCVSKVKQVTPKIAIPIKWTKPFPGWHKLNTDGASLGNPGKADGGGLIRDSEGRCIRGYSRSIGHTTSVMAKLWALKDGLNLAIQLGIGYLEVELDAKVIVEMLKNSNSTNIKVSPLLLDCRSLIARFMQVRLAYVYREGNRCADLLAKNGCYMREDFVIFETSPSAKLDRLLIYDCNGLYYYRRVATTLASVASL
ncbi:uncharacterized protein LOC142629055 [Castanea sativa]|uniref:uncharacterized protein LOC142629055 n=1 Tax=Castanea sativa TaxID=21020 RepID=UPI003F651EF9